VAEREGFSAPLRRTSKTAVKSAFSARQVVCTGSMYRNRSLSSSGFGRMVNAFHHPAHRGSQTATGIHRLPA
jgi:hypothetical protein